MAKELRERPVKPSNGPNHQLEGLAKYICVLVIRPFGLLVQVVRSSMLTVFSSAYIKTARAKGVSERAIIFIHALRNAMLPVVTVAGDQADVIA